MVSSLTVTADATTVTLDSARQGKVTFKAANSGAQPLRARAYASAEGTAAAGWFALDGMPVRDIASGASETYTVTVNVPANALPGNYSFKINVVGADNPDEDFASSPAVGFVVSGAVVRPPVKKGYIEALGGGVIGAFVGGVIGIIPALLFILTTGEPADFSTIIGTVFCFAVLAVVGTPLGIWLGTAIGVWAGLKWRGCEFPRRTALVSAVLMLLLLIGLGFLLGAINIQNGTISQIVTVLAAVIVAAGASLGARALVLMLTKQL